MRTADIQMIHQADQITPHFRAIGGAVMRFGAFAMATRIQRNHAVFFRQSWKDTALHPLAFGIGGIAMDQQHRLTPAIFQKAHPGAGAIKEAFLGRMGGKVGDDTGQSQRGKASALHDIPLKIFLPRSRAQTARSRQNTPRNPAPQRLYLRRHFGDYGDKHGSE